MFSIDHRKLLRLVTLSIEVVGKFRFVWKGVRKDTLWLSKTYFRIVKIAEKLGVQIPKTKINMEVQK